MGTSINHFCDRCKKPLVFEKRKFVSIIMKNPRRKFIRRFYHNSPICNDQIYHDQEFELCGACNEKFEKFLLGEENV